MEYGPICFDAFQESKSIHKGKNIHNSMGCGWRKNKTRVKPKQNGMRNNNMDKKESESQLFH